MESLNRTMFEASISWRQRLFFILLLLYDDKLILILSIFLFICLVFLIILKWSYSFPFLKADANARYCCIFGLAWFLIENVSDAENISRNNIIAEIAEQFFYQCQ